MAPAVAATGVAILAAVGLLIVGRAGPEHPPGAVGTEEVAYQRHPAATARPDTELPGYARSTPELAALYRFAVSRPEVLSYIPCTCGCGANGHLSNWNCYVRAVMADGTVVFDDMAPT